MTASEWAATNPILNPGEPGLETNTGLMKVGLPDESGSGRRWNDTPYQNGLGVSGDLANLTDVDLTDIATDDLIQYSSSGKWINRSLAEAGIAPIIHNHDNSYYTKTQVTAMIAAAVPSGVISQFAGSTAPTGYQLCLGQSLSKTTYPELHAAIGYTYGGSGDTFYLPNLQNRVPVAKGSGSFASLGNVGGSQTVQLSEANLPGHTHTYSGTTSENGSHTHGNPVAVVYGGDAGNYRSLFATNSPFWNGNDPNNATAPAGTHSHTYSGTTSTGSGSGTAHENMPPYIVVNYIIKT